MDTKLPNSATETRRKLESELARYQKVLDAYHAFPGDTPEPASSLDQSILARAQSAVAPTKAASSPSLLRRWPVAIAASVATIGFATILARHSLREPPPSYDSAPAMRQEQSAPQMQPAAAPQEEATGNSAGLGAATASSESVPKGEAPTEELAAKRESRSAPKPNAPALVSAPPPPPSEPMAEVAAQAADLAKPADSGTLHAKQAARREAPEEAPEDASAAEPVPVQSARAVQSMPAPAASSVPMPMAAPAASTPMPASVAPEPMPAAAMDAAPERSEAKEALDTSVADREIDVATDAAPSGDAYVEQAEEKRDAAGGNEIGRSTGGALGLTAIDPDEVFFERLRKLRERGELVQARALLREFQKANPDKVIPDDLRDLLQNN